MRRRILLRNSPFIFPNLSSKLHVPFTQEEKKSVNGYNKKRKLKINLSNPINQFRNIILFKHSCVTIFSAVNRDVYRRSIYFNNFVIFVIAQRNDSTVPNSIYSISLGRQFHQCKVRRTLK